MDENLSRGYCQIQDPPRIQFRNELSNSNQPASFHPKDRCSCVYIALVICGAGFLLPYNSFITAVDYYLNKYPNSTIVFDMSLTYICIAFVSVILNNIFVELLPLQARITFGYIISFITLLLIASLDISLQYFSPEVSYRVTLVAVATVSLGCTVQQSSFYGYTSMLPSRYTQAVMAGESAAGLIVSINRILTKALLPHSVSLNTLIFFIISMVTILFCCVIFHVTRRSDFVRYHVALCQNAGIAEDERGITQNPNNPEEVSLVDIMDGHVTRDSYGVLILQSPTTPPGGDLHHTTDDDIAVVPPTVAEVRLQEVESQVQSRGHSYRRHITSWQAIKQGCINRYRVSKNVWPYMLSIGLAYFVTLCLFPGIESEVVSCRLGDWMPVLLISVFNLFDFIGKIIASAPYDWPRCQLFILTLCRIFLVPLLMLCVAPRGQPIIRGEFWPLLFSILLGISNGYFGSIPMILAPSRVPDDQKELSGNIMTLSYSVGLTGGSAVAYLLDEWLGPHGPSPCDTERESHLLAAFNMTLHKTLPYLPNDLL